MNPTFSIIIPTYNRANILFRAVNSIMAQTFKDYEIIVVDDGSTDNSRAIIEEIQGSSIQYIYQSNAGVSAARNNGAKRAMGNYLVFLDSDDELKTDYFSVVNKAIAHSPDSVFVSVDLFKGGKFSHQIKADSPFGKYSSYGLYLAGSFVLKKEIFLQAGGYDTNIRYGENTELAIRLEPYLKNKVFLNEVVLNVFQGSEDRTSNSFSNTISSLEYMLVKHFNYYKSHPHPKWLYHNKLAVAYIKMNDRDKSLGHLAEAIGTYPWRLKAYLRYFIISVPFLKRRIYKI